ncbi:alkaline phosphatase D family protein [Desertimonas flava]|uniref:alkaline phosphatase D family protein n=1 Tax=Desertimonas flava TaxID=2064846 RepID=UPI001968E944|nr:alkaline phosphatase D family protein [Desertimonas flava]
MAAPTRVSRRRFISLGGAVAAGLTGSGIARGAAGGVRFFGTSAEPPITRDPFTLGVASGDPWPGSVVLWTRLLPRPDRIDDPGLGQRSVDVAWQIATDPSMRVIERHGVARAEPAHGHSVHVTADGLRPGREYWYRFRTGSWLSPIGRTKTAPATDATPARLDLIAASCQSWAAGYYTAHRHIAAEHPDVVVFLGDYIYERPITATDCARLLPTDLPPHLATETDTLERYRAQYAWYRQDPDLQASHRAAPWVVTWDDHEVQDNYAGFDNVSGLADDRFAARRAAAYQAYWEHLPLRSRPPIGPSMTMHRRLDFGTLLLLEVLDTRQFRSRQMSGAGWTADAPGRRDPGRTMLGDSQQRWLEAGLRTSPATWNVIAQQVMLGRIAIESTDGPLHNVDTWDGYPVAQRRMHDALAATANPVVLTGDLHAGYALDVTAAIRHDSDRDVTPIAAEFAATSISSGGDGSDESATHRRLLRSNPHLHYAKPRRGYLRCRVSPREMTVDFRTVLRVERDAHSPVSTDRSFVVEAGRRGIHTA